MTEPKNQPPPQSLEDRVLAKMLGTKPDPKVTKVKKQPAKKPRRK